MSEIKDNPNEEEQAATQSGVEQSNPPTKSKVASSEGSKSGSKVEEGENVQSQAEVKSDVGEGKVESNVEPKKSITRSKSTDGGSTKSTEKRVSSTDHRKSRVKLTDVSAARVGFIGAGRMTDSITKGLLKTEKIPAKQIFVAAKSNKNLDMFKVQGITTTTRSYDIFGKYDCDVIFLCFHGFVVRNCFKMGGTRPFPFTTNYIPCRKKHLFVLSLVGGIPLADIKTTLLNPEQPNKYQIEMHRVMLNSSVAYNLGLGVLDVELDSKKCHPVIRDILQSLARIEYLDAGLMDAACAVGGNGLAFVYYFVSALADGGFKMGLSKNMSTKLATKSLQSAALCLLESNKSPSELRDMSTSPSSPTIYGITVLEKQDCSAGIQAAIEASYKRIKELIEIEK